MKTIVAMPICAVLFAACADELDLAGEWTLRGEDRAGAKTECRAAVPGGVHSALLANGLMEDVFYGRNEERCLWVSRRPWTFSRDFDVPESFLSQKEIVLRVEDCDTFCEISVNGTPVGRTADRFRRYEFDVKPYLKPGVNTISGRFESPVAAADAIAAERKRAYPMSNVMWAKNQAHIRKPACHAGWDWGPELEVIGFCGTVKVIGSNRPRIDYVHTRQTFSDDLSHCTLDVFADMSDGTTVTNRVEIDDPPLWWPNGCGERRFYTYTVDVNGEKVTRKIGLRKLEVLNEKSVSKDGKDELSLVFRVNNRRIFAKGANWIPCDAYENRQTPERYRDLLESAAAANMNMIRVWGGGQYEKDCFYDICDELGLLVWHDMMFACATYPFDARMRGDVEGELSHQLRRLKDHASIALWCGDNECLGAIGWFDETRSDREFYRAQWIARSEFQGEMVAKYDPSRTYWPSSPCCGPGDFGNAWKDDSKGDMHNWNVWHENMPFDDYYNYRPRFCSEFGYQSFPSMEIAETFASRAEIESHGDDFEWHQKNPGGNRRIRETMARYFKAPKDVESELLLSQFQHSMAMKMACEGWRAQRPRCMGTLFWQLNDNWPVASWSSIEYGGKWKPVQYMARRFFAPLAVVGGPDGTIAVLNDLSVPAKGRVVAEYTDFSGRVLRTDEFSVDVAPDSVQKVGRFNSPGPGGTPQFLALRLETDRGSFENDWQFGSYRDMPLARAKIDVAVNAKGAREFEVALSSDAPVFFVWANVRGVRGEFDDNCLTLLPGRPRTLVFRAKEDVSPDEFRKRLSVVSLADLSAPSARSAVKLGGEVNDGRPSKRWRGFNLTAMLNRDWNPLCAGFDEEDFRTIAGWGFNFVRLPLDYRYWIKDGDRANWEVFDEAGLRKIDDAVAFGKKHGLHVQICLHRIPGYSSGTPQEPTDIFTDPESLRVACVHWRKLAERYMGVSNEEVAFNLFNEPNYVDEAKYVPVAKALEKAIRDVDPKRFIIADGLGYGRLPAHGLDGEKGVGVGLRGYDPLSVTHYKAPWLTMPEETPKWPLEPRGDGPRVYADDGKEFYYRESLKVWDETIAKDIFAYVGEFGVWRATPHETALAFMEDVLSVWKERNLGWALWELRGSFGVMDSERTDVEYEDFNGHKLDRRMLELLQRY